MHPFVAATAVRLHVTHGALTEMRLVTTVALKRRRNHTPSHANCLPDAYRVYYSLSLPRSASKPNSLAKPCWARVSLDRKSTRLNSSHGYISYAVFCLKKKKNQPSYRLSLEPCRTLIPSRPPTLATSL